MSDYQILRSIGECIQKSMSLIEPRRTQTMNMKKTMQALYHSSITLLSKKHHFENLGTEKTALLER